MTNYLEEYLEILAESSPEAAESARITSMELVTEHIETFSHMEHVKGLLLGHVQSGKTGQIFATLAATADADDSFRTFILLTSDNVELQKQTFRRALDGLPSFNICDESDEERFIRHGKFKPSVVILKKNTRVLQNWRNILSTTDRVVGGPIFIVDDEADAASLNTLVNSDEQSKINKHLEDIVGVATSSFYLQVTATPQALLLQRESSGWKPDFVKTFKPGPSYLGGNFFYSRPASFTHREIPETEQTALLNGSSSLSGLRSAVITYLLTAAQIGITKSKDACNFLIHPHYLKSAHSTVEITVRKLVEEILGSIMTSHLEPELEDAYVNLQSTKPDIRKLKNLRTHLHENVSVNVASLNTDSSATGQDFVTGNNIIVGGNTLGRGVTFSSLQTVYYSRQAKSPQADTFWQHCRMFGYDRDPLLMRVFMPGSLLHLYSELNEANEQLFNQIQQGDFDDVKIVLGKGINPTRKAVVDRNSYGYLVGGVNSFPHDPIEQPPLALDDLLEKRVGSTDGVYEVGVDTLIEVLSAIACDETDTWAASDYIVALKSICQDEASKEPARLIVRRDRNIGRGTGTLLSPSDQQLGKEFHYLPVLTLYRVTGSASKGWSGNPFWIPNVKLPSGKVIHLVTG